MPLLYHPDSDSGSASDPSEVGFHSPSSTLVSNQKPILFTGQEPSPLILPSSSLLSHPEPITMAQTNPDSSSDSILIPTLESDLNLTSTHTHTHSSPSSDLVEIEYQHEPLFWIQRQLPIEHLHLNNPIHTRRLRRYARIPAQVGFLSSLSQVDQPNQLSTQPPSIRSHLPTHHSDSALSLPFSSSSTIPINLNPLTINPHIHRAQTRPSSTFSVSVSSNSTSNPISQIFDSPLELSSSNHHHPQNLSSRSPTPSTTSLTPSSSNPQSIPSSPHSRNKSSSSSLPRTPSKRFLSPQSHAQSMMHIKPSAPSISLSFLAQLHPNAPINGGTLDEGEGDLQSNSWSANRNSVTGTPDFTTSITNTDSQPSLRSPLQTRPTSTCSTSSPQSIHQLDSNLNQKQINLRSRVISELIDTEAIYASDMAIARDIYSAKALTVTPRRPFSTKRTQSNTHTITRTVEDRSKTHLPFPPSSNKLNLGTVLTFGSKRRSTAGLRRTDSTGSRTSKKLLSPLTASNHEPIYPSSPLMSSLDHKTIFSNIDEIACLADRFTHLLRKANGCNSDGMSDTIGTCFFQMLPKIQQVFMTYCSKYQASNNRLQSLLPNLTDYLNHCHEMSRGCTAAWDLPSLLIKPVQRCLKYPLLLDQILQLTPLDHPDRHQLEEAKTGMIAVADSINEAKRRCEHIEEIIGSKSSPSMNLKRPNSKKGRLTIINIGTSTQNLPMMIKEERRMASTEDLNQIIKRIYKSRKSVIELPEVILDWSAKMNQMSEQSSRLVKAFKAFYTLHQTIGSADFRYLNAYQQHVALASAIGPFQVMDARLKNTIIPLCKTLLKTYENPIEIILKRNPRDELLEDQLIAELPKFEAATQKFWNAILFKLEKIQQDVFFDLRVLIKHFDQTYYQRDEHKKNGHLSGLFDRFSIINQFFDPLRQQIHESFVLLNHNQLQVMVQSEAEAEAEAEAKVQEKIGIAMTTY